MRRTTPREETKVNDELVAVTEETGADVMRAIGTVV